MQNSCVRVVFVLTKKSQVDPNLANFRHVADVSPTCRQHCQLNGAVVVFSCSKILFNSSWSISLHSSMLSFDSFFSFLSQLIVDLNDVMSLPCDLLPSIFLFELQFDIEERTSAPARPDLLWFKPV